MLYRVTEARNAGKSVYSTMNHKKMYKKLDSLYTNFTIPHTP